MMVADRRPDLARIDWMRRGKNATRRKDSAVVKFGSLSRAAEILSGVIRLIVEQQTLEDD
jgi:hypothetical protein